MASFRKRGKGYQATIYVCTDDVGIRINKYVTAPTLKECKTLAREIEEDIASNGVLKVKDIRLSNWLDKWLEQNSSRLAPSTYTTYKTYSNIHLKPFFGKKKLSQITEMHIKDYMSEKLKYLSATTVRKHMMFLRMVLYDALKNRSPFSHDISMPQNAKYVPVIPTHDEFNLIVNSCKLKKHELIILIAGKCGLRLGEIFALKWEDIDFNKKTIRIDEALCRTDTNEYIFKTPKSNNGYRTVPCSDEILTKLQEFRLNPYKSTNKNSNVISFPSCRIFDGRPDNFSYNFAKRMDRLGLHKIRFHDLRHYCASWLYEYDVPDIIAAEMLGHDVLVLKGIYQHIGLDKKKETIDRIRQIQNGYL